jgi:hypothetical protein
MLGKIGSDRSADAEANRKDGPAATRLRQIVEDYKRVREQRLGARPPAARRIAAIVERDDIVMRKERVQGEGHSEVRGEDAYFEEIPNLKLPEEMKELAHVIIERKAGHFQPLLRHPRRHARPLGAKSSSSSPARVEGAESLDSL